MPDFLILVVDDLADWRVTLKGLLSDMNYHCNTASSSQQAIEMLSKEDYQLAIVDVRLDETDESNQGGLDIVNWLAETHCPTKAIVITGYDTQEIMKKAISSGVVVDFISKVQTDKLIMSISNLRLLFRNRSIIWPRHFS